MRTQKEFVVETYTCDACGKEAEQTVSPDHRRYPQGWVACGFNWDKNECACSEACYIELAHLDYIERTALETASV